MRIILRANALSPLGRLLQIFCTEPYRVPMAGKVDVCLFDKTGTLTTDELVAVGVEAPDPSEIEGFNKTGGDGRSSLMDTLVTMLEAPPAATLVLAGCQSLVLMEGSEAGDPVEAAAMKSIKVSPFFWSWQFLVSVWLFAGRTKTAGAHDSSMGCVVAHRVFAKNSNALP